MSTAECTFVEDLEASTFDADLQAYLEAEELTDTIEDADRVSLDVWIDRRLYALRRIKEDAAHNYKVADRRIAMIADAVAEQNAPLLRRAEYLEALIQQVAVSYPYPPAKTKGSKRVLPCGEIGVTRHDAKLVVDDPTEVITWAKELDMPEFIRVKEEVAKAVVNEYFASTGRDIPGTHVEPAREVPFVKVGA